ncbi:MAG: hypothetical protein ACXWVQ_09975 [Methyloceanibacter sp.]
MVVVAVAAATWAAAVAASAAAVISPAAAAISAAMPGAFQRRRPYGTGGGPRNGGLGPRYGANDHVGNGNGHYDHDHFNHDHGRHVRYFPGDAFFYGGDYADYGSYGGDCSWLARQARATGSAYWWHRYQACTY